MNYTFEDIKQTMIGAFVASLLFVVLRAGDPLHFNEMAGLMLTLVVIFLSNPTPRKKNLDVFGLDIFFTYVAVSLLNIVFNLTSFDNVTFGLFNGTFPNLSVFGTSNIVAFWIALPVAVLFNKFNISNFLSRIFIHKR